MWPVSFLLLIGLFQATASINWDLQKLQAPSQSPPKNVLKVTPVLSDSAEDWKKAREAAVVKPFAGDVKSYAGYFTVNKEYDSNLYFWFFPSEKNAEKAPLILWVHGGPAESAMMGLFEENGPYKIVKGNVTLRETSWTKHYNVLYLDSPVGCGYSYTSNLYGYAQHLYEVVANLYRALTLFYKMFPEYEKNAFYLVGQSYGGKFIPPLAALIHKKNNVTGCQKMNLRGIMIGGGSLDPVQQLAYGEYAYEYAVVDRGDANEMNNNAERAKCLLDSGHVKTAAAVLRKISDKMEDSGYPTPLDVNDPHINVSCYDQVETFITREDVRQQIHAGDARFRDRKVVLWYLQYYLLGSVNVELSTLVQLGYPVLLYSGQYDMVTPPEQIDKVIANIAWKNKQQFRQAQAKPWYSHGELAGYKKSYANLQQVLVRKANHMIVRSQPKWMLDLLRSFAV